MVEWDGRMKCINASNENTVYVLARSMQFQARYTNAYKVLYNRTGGCSVREATTKVSIKHFRTREGCSVREISNVISSLGGGCNARIRYFNNSCTFKDGEGGLWKMY